MGKIIIMILIIYSLFIANTYATSTKEAEEAENWFKNLSRRKEKVANLRFYIQATFGGPNATVWEVARAAITSQSPTMFGQVRVADVLITAEPDRNSEKLGWVQGLATYADLNELGEAVNLNIVFTAGEYNGSTLCILGRNAINTRNRELAVVGGTGVFRMARGFIIVNTYSYDPVKSYSVYEYVVFVSYV